MKRIVSNVFEVLRFVRGDSQLVHWEALALSHELAPDTEALAIDGLRARIDAKNAAVLAGRAGALAVASLADVARMAEESTEIAFAAGD